MKFPDTVFKFTVPVPVTFRFVALTSFSNVTVSVDTPAFISANFAPLVPTAPETVELPLKVNVPSLSVAVVIGAFIFELSAKTTVPSPVIFKLSEFIDELNKTDNSIFEFKDFKENYFKNKFKNSKLSHSYQIQHGFKPIGFHKKRHS